MVKNRETIKIKELSKAEHSLLEEFIYHAIFVPTGEKQPERSIIHEPDIFVYIENFGSEGDCGVFAEIDGKAVGAAWVRIIPAYGHVDDKTPELAISVLPEYRNQKTGEMLMESLFDLLRKRGYKQTSLAVQKENPAVAFYLRLGYKVIKEKTEEYLMIKELKDEQ